jgi:hypothetical protein
MIVETQGSTSAFNIIVMPFDTHHRIGDTGRIIHHILNCEDYSVASVTTLEV